jgi:uncharacterized membrane-anchored protein
MKNSLEQNIEVSPRLRQLFNKVPEITLYFWVIKVLCTTVGETAADFLNTTLNLGLNGTTLVMGVLLIIVLFFQFRTRKYTAGLYWLAVVLISVFGTLITDNLIDNFGISLQTTTIVFSIILAAVFAVWFAAEKTLSMHTIYTSRREAFYWLAILFTFALGTAAGDLSAEAFHLGYALSVGIFAGLIALITAIYFACKAMLGANRKGMASYGVLAFWLAYILTRPLGASMGDYLSQAQSAGGLGLGTIITSGIFLAAILATVVYLSVTKKDVTKLTEQN